MKEEYDRYNYSEPAAEFMGGNYPNGWSNYQNIDHESAVEYGKPGEGSNGTGIGGVYYDWVSNTYRLVDDPTRSFDPTQSGEGVNILSAYLHYKFGGGTDYNVDISKVDWSMLTAKDFPKGVGSVRQINVFSKKPNSTAGAVFGDILLEYLGNNKIKVADVFIDGPKKGESYYDTYNYNVRWGEVINGQNLIRNFATGLGWIGINMPWHPRLLNTYGGDTYKFIFHGIGTIGGGQ